MQDEEVCFLNCFLTILPIWSWNYVWPASWEFIVDRWERQHELQCLSLNDITNTLFLFAVYIDTILF